MLSTTIAEQQDNNNLNNNNQQQQQHLTNHLGFPIIKSYQDIKECIKGKKEFVTQIDKGYIFIKYKSILNSTFPDIIKDKEKYNEKDNKINYLLRRECRGIVFDRETGQLVLRKFHKFFNINERSETSIENINWKRPFQIFEKLDGSLVSPIYLDFQKRKNSDISNISFVTMLGFTQLSQQIMNNYINTKLQELNLRKYFLEFCKYCLDNQLTPLFEYTSPLNQIVIKYTEEKLTLLAIRRNENGKYLNYNEILQLLKLNTEWGRAVHLVQIWKSFPNGLDGNPNELLSEIYQQKHLEGYVLHFEGDDDFYKIKTKFYTCFHCISSNNNNNVVSNQMRERHFIKLICNDVIDDLISTFYFTNEMRNAIIRYKDEFNKKLLKLYQFEIWFIIKKAILLKNEGKEINVNQLLPGKMATTPGGQFIKEMLERMDETVKKEEKKEEIKKDIKDEIKKRNVIVQEFDFENPNRKWDDEEENESEDEEDKEEELFTIVNDNNQSDNLTSDIKQENNITEITEENGNNIIESSSTFHFGSLKNQTLENLELIIYDYFKTYLQLSIFQVNDPKLFEKNKQRNYEWLEMNLSVLKPFYFDPKTSCLVKGSGGIQKLQQETDEAILLDKKNKKKNKKEEREAAKKEKGTMLLLTDNSNEEMSLSSKSKHLKKQLKKRK
ncbi:hypothetical protein ABK040_002323 [Willaertia magna]